MALVFALILLGVAFYLRWKWTRTTLTRNCRWRKDAGRGQWRCAYCGATMPDAGTTPLVCLSGSGRSKRP